ncbi:VWA domain-containing protein [Aeromicrobium piscarium]|uniref:Mg-protoporphyrin IX chelatase n=1 Tax=Aeromicrobium piscarium TaxID=2590901 RepID=A0A554S839_9ACTN|nr:VWA domain-containing protein [Aeromicrobium piscarium]TSD62492.1 VWA domain-containing protein [Aeromicrobium piscarium]
MPARFPFCAVAGADDMALALTLAAIAPDLGGVLVRGEKGTAKSTMVRALADVLPPIEVVSGDRFSSDPRDPSSPDGPFDPDPATEQRPVRLVELPVGATDDRVLGSLHLHTALAEGRAEFEPGLLAKAHRGILYVDEVNLLHDHLVDLLLDAAAMGRATVERDGMSVEYAARFVLVGTMNPEEGELRPQLLDRFGLTVDVAAPRDPGLRAEIVRRRLAFDADPEGFAARYADDEQELRERITTAQKLLPEVELTDAVLTRIAEICAAFDVDGMRADIVTAKAAATHAAWQGRTTIDRDDIAVAARLALPHRRRRNPFDAPGIDEQELEDLLGDDEPDDPQGPDDDTDPGGGGGTPDPGQNDDGPGDDAAAPPPPQSGQGDEQAPAPTSQVRAGEAQRTKTFRVGGVGRGQAGRRSRAITDTGRRIAASPAADGGAVDLGATIRAAIPHQGARGRTTGRLRLAGDDLRVAVKEGRESNLVLLCVDASGSMAARKRMAQVKTAVVSLLLDAYQRRDKVALVTFRGDAGELVLPPTGSVDVAKARLDDVPAGGRTPLAEGLTQAAEVIRRERLRDPRRRPLLVVVTDGRATHGADAIARARRVAQRLAASDVHALVVDCETGRFTLGLARELAGHLGADYVPLGEVTADGLTSAISAHLPEKVA